MNQTETHFDGTPHSKNSLRFWLRLMACTRLMDKRVRTLFRTEFDTTLPRFDLLAGLDHAGRALTMGELSQRLMVSNGNVTGIITKLVEEGYVSRRRGEGDGRQLMVELTAEGKAHFNTIAKAHEKWIDSMLEDFSDDELQALLGPLTHLKSSLEESGWGLERETGE